MTELNRYCRECGGHIYRQDLTTQPAKYRWQCDEGCTVSVLMLKGAPFPTEFEVGGPRPLDL